MRSPFKHQTVPLYFLLLFALLFIFLIQNSKTQAQDNIKRLKYGVTGSIRSSIPKNLNPYYILEHIPVQKILIEVARQPRNKKFIEAALEGIDISIDDLEKSGLLRPEESLYFINFTLFTKDDIKKIRQQAKVFSRSLKKAYISRQSEIVSILNRYDANGVDPREVAFIVIGCFSLDWDGMRLIRQNWRNFSTGRDLKVKKTYQIWAEEIHEHTLKNIYWGSHNEYYPHFVFTSFGDHFSLPRSTYPDILWRMNRAVQKIDYPESLKPMLTDFGSQAHKEYLANAGRIMFALRTGKNDLAELKKACGLNSIQAKKLVKLFTELGYIKEESGLYYSNIPVLTQQDFQMVQELMSLSREIISAWLDQNNFLITDELKDITPLKHGVPSLKVFIQIWHYVFGMTNQALVEAGLFADPYAESRKLKGFIPAVWHPSLRRTQR